MDPNAQAQTSAPSEDDLLASMMGEGPKEQVRQPNPRKADDRSAAKTSPGGKQQSGDILDDDDDDDDVVEDRRSSKKPAKQVDEDPLEDDDTDDDYDGADDDDEEDDDPLAYAFGEGDDDADHDRDDDGEDDPIDASKLRDDLELSVTVDGEDRTVTLGELRRRYAGEGAIERRLQEATEARNNALTDFQKGQELVTGLLQNMGNALFRRMVPAPDEGLRTSDPTRYLMQKDAYDRETAAMQGQYSQLEGMMQQVEQQNEERKRAHRQEAAKTLRKIMPAIADPVKGPKLRSALISAAKEIGYTDQQIADCDDPLMFKTVALAARELRRTKGVQITRKAPKAQGVVSKGTQNRPNKPNVQRKQETAYARAAKNPTDDNLLATMLTEAKPQKRRRR